MSGMDTTGIVDRKFPVFLLVLAFLFVVQKLVIEVNFLYFCASYLCQSRLVYFVE